ncbi:hypothetical protein [Dactylosporangium sp. CS-033363]|uniref:hypothetical protein n=1 Tax=Dactylosporangium sp. CS-033363 TaxID=3239935 RepID=UPI003D914C04
MLAPLLMALATLAERRLGPSAAGWVAALPVSLAVAVTAVGLRAGPGAASAMAYSAAGHLPAQVGFAVLFALVLARRGLVAGLAAGTGAYVALAWMPAVVGIALAVPALVLAPRLIPAGPREPGRSSGAPRTRAAGGAAVPGRSSGAPRTRAAGGAAVPGRSSGTLLTCAASAAVVAAAIGAAAVAGPVAAGAVAAFPAMSATLAVAVARTAGIRAAGHALAGLVRSLPCYGTFALVTALAAGHAGPAAALVALPAALAAGWLTWRGVPARATIAAP